MCVVVAALLAVAFVSTSAAATPPPVQSAIDDLGVAMKYELNAMLELTTKPPRTAEARTWLSKSLLELDEARAKADSALRSKKLRAKHVRKARACIDSAMSKDSAVTGLLADGGSAAAAIAQLREAITKKACAEEAFEDSMVVRVGDRCETSKRFEVYGVPDGGKSSQNDVFVHVPKGAQNVAIDFVDAKSGAKAPTEVFKGQFWQWEQSPAGAKTKVRVNVIGPGSGAFGDLRREWIVVVTFDLPGGCD